jgi:steroid delta-isomerase-like uncharacterized protein
MVCVIGCRYASSSGAHSTNIKRRASKGECIMTVDETKALIRRLVEEFWNQGHLAAADELLTPDALIVLPGRGQVSLADLKAFARAFRSAFPDWQTTIEEIVVEGDRAAERWTGRGTHQGEFEGIAPTGKAVTVPGVVFYRTTAGKISEFRGQLDGLALLHQLGANPDQR